MEHDLKLIAGEDKIKITVSRLIMSNASPVFRQMLLPGRFSEGYIISHEGSLDLTLEDDQADAMRILCNIFHLRTNLVPIKTITSNTMADLATLVDKYDCATAIQPWPKIWRDHETIQKETADLGKWIHISAQLGYEDIFRTTTSVLIGNANEDGLQRGPLLLKFSNLSQTLQERIEATRQKSLDAYQTICCSLVGDIEGGNGCRHRAARMKVATAPATEAEFDCSSIALGNALLAFRDFGGQHWRSNPWIGTVRQTYEKLQKDVAGRLGGPGRIYHHSRNYSPSHSECSLSQIFEAQIKRVYDDAIIGLEIRELGNHIYRNNATEL